MDKCSLIEVLLQFELLAPDVDHRFCQHHQPVKSTSDGANPAATTTAANEQHPENKEQKLDRLALAEYLNENGSYDDKLCNVFRSGISKSSKNSTYGFLATFLNCSVIVGFTEQACSEGSKSKSSYFAPRLMRYYFHLLHDISAASTSSHINNTAV